MNSVPKYSEALRDVSQLHPDHRSILKCKPSGRVRHNRATILALLGVQQLVVCHIPAESAGRIEYWMVKWIVFQTLFDYKPAGRLIIGPKYWFITEA